MRILQVLPRYAPAWSFGGGVRMFWTLAAQLAARGHEVRVITSDSLGPDQRLPIREELIAPRIHVSRYRNRFNRLSTYIGPVFYRPRGMRRAIEDAGRWADVVHVGESRGPHNVWAANARRRSGSPLVWSPYGGLPRAHGIRGVYRALYDAAFTRSVISSTDRFVAQTPHEAEVLRRHGAAPERIRLIPLCVDWPDFEILPQRGRFRDRLGLRADDHLIVSVARLSAVKGLDTLIRAMAQVRRTRNGPYLALVGWDHGAESSLRSRAADLGISDRVFFPGPLFGRDRLLSYVDADIFALAPRVFEETSLAGLEAAACGIPTVLAHECEIPGMADAGGGLVVDGVPNSVAAALSRLLEDPSWRLHMGQIARATVAEAYTGERIALMHEKIFEEARSAASSRH